MPYAGPNGVEAIFSHLSAHHGWHPSAEYEGGPQIALLSERSSITLEPGAQLELSGAPLGTIHDTFAEFTRHRDELESISPKLGITWLGLGFHPFARRNDLQWVPKMRYGVMRNYLPTRGSLALDMMLRTCTVQANLDYSSEEDAMRKLRVSLRVQPFVTALFANSPFVEGRATGERTHRARVWLDMDPDRCGLLPTLWSEKTTFRSYVEWALDVPMFLVKRGSTIHKNAGQTFRAFMKDGFEGERATIGDWDSHLNTLFPEARLKRTLELRGADSQPLTRCCALPALWRGLLYDKKALDALDTWSRDFKFDEVEALRPAIADHALQAKFRGRAVADWAGELLAIAEEGLDRLNCRNEKGQTERIYLAPIRKLVDQGKCPADELLAAVSEAPNLPDGVLRAARFDQ